MGLAGMGVGVTNALPQSISLNRGLTKPSPTREFPPTGESGIGVPSYKDGFGT